MALTLSAQLQAAQDGSSHHPIIELISRPMTDEIPFAGLFLTNETTDEQKPNMIMHSSGRICIIYTFGTESLKFVKTDTAKTQFYTTTLTNADLGCLGIEVAVEASLCELNNDNKDIGIIFVSSDATNYYLRRAIIDINGNVLSTGLIATYIKATYPDVKSPFVLKLINNTYYLVYILDTSDTVSSIYKRTSNDFISWSAKVLIDPVDMPGYLKENVSLFQYAQGTYTGYMILLFDATGEDTDWYNCYQSISSDNGANWGQATALTSYDNASASGMHPFAYQIQEDTVNLVFYERKSSIAIGEGWEGWPEWPDGTGVVDLTIDTTERKIYCTCARDIGGWKYLEAVVEVDIDTFEVLKYWDFESTPKFTDHFLDENENFVWWLSNQGEYPYIPISERRTRTGPLGYDEANNWTSPDPLHVEILNVEADSISEHEFYGAQRIWNYWVHNEYVVSTFVKNGLLYVLTQKELGLEADGTQIRVKIIDIGTGESVPDEFLGISQASGQWIMIKDFGLYVTQGVKNGQMWVDGGGRVWISYANTTSDWEGGLMILDPFNLSNQTVCYIYSGDGKFIKYCNCYNSGILLHIGTHWGEAAGSLEKRPYRGIKRFTVVGKKLYGIFDYDGVHHAGRRGIIILDFEATGLDPDSAFLPTTDEIEHLYENIVASWSRPTWATLDDYGFNDITHTDDGKILISSDYGISVFDPETNEWKLYDNDSVPGFTPDEQNVCWPIKYDPVNEMIFTGIPRHTMSTFEGLLGVPLDGYICQTYYKQCSIGEGGVLIDPESESKFIRNYKDYDAVVAVDSDDQSIYAFWTNDTNNELSIKWDHEEGYFDLTDYLLRSTDLVLKWNIENKPGELTFSVSNGHLFDPSNTQSLLSRALRRDRKVTVRIGEEVSSTNYWANQGSFLVKEFKMSGFKKDEYPTASVKCEDMISLLKDIKCVTTDYYDCAPEDAIEDMLENEAEWESDDIDDFTFDNTTDVYFQGMDNDLMQMISDICDRFGYFFIVDMDGIFTCRKISDSNDIDHTYTNINALIEWTPDYEYADSVNQITVIGEERDFNELLYPEEPIVTKSGTTGWWSGGERIKCYYADDKSRKCYYPRVEWITETMGLGLWQDKLDMTVESHDDFLGCDLIIEADNLIDHILVLVAEIAATWAIPDGVGAGSTIPIGRIAESILFISILDTLMSITNWQATIHARPVGNVRRSVQATSNDRDYQYEIDKIISVTIDEPLCYTVTECQQVADYEIMLKRLQRNKMSFSKIAHLQDETGDTVCIIHPYGGQNVYVFITSLTRRYKKASGSGKNDGHIIDDISGWIVR